MSRSRSASRRSRSPGRWALTRWSSGAVGPRPRPRLPRPRRRGRGAALAGTQPAEESGDPLALLHAYVSLTDVLMMLGRPREAARIGERGLEAVRRYGIDQHAARCELHRGPARHRRVGQSRQPQRGRAPRHHRQLPYMLLMLRADLELGRGDFEAARAHLDAALATLREDRGAGDLRRLPRRARAVGAAVDGRRPGCTRRPGRGELPAGRPAPRLVLRQGAACPGGAGRARARPPGRRRRPLLARPGREAHRHRPRPPPRPRPPRSRHRWLALAEAEHRRALGDARSELWAGAADTWERLERPPLAAYCRWRQAEALVAAGASRAEASGPLRQAHAVAADRAAPWPGSSSCSASARGSSSRRRTPGQRPEARPGGDPRPDAARGGGPDPHRPRLHQPRDRGDPGHQRPDGRRPRLAHPAQARRPEPARGSRDRAPPPPPHVGQPQFEV